MNRNIPWRSTRNLQALAGGKTDWYRITNKVGGGPAQIHIYDEIGFLAIGAQNFVRDLANIDGPVDVHINSPGGEVFEGITIYNALLGRKDVTVYIDGLCASIASVIAMAGNPVLIARQATVMVHEGHVMAAAGDAQDMRDLAEALDRQSNNIATIYSEHSGKPVAFWREMMKATTWMTADQAIEYGLADRFIENGNGRVPAEPYDKFDLSGFRNSGRQRPEQMQDAAHHPYVGPHDHMHEPMTGHHSHNHAAFGHPDAEDGIHAHAHAHAGDATHGHEHTTHSHSHEHGDDEHMHAHDAGQDHFGPHTHEHTHHGASDHYDPDHDGDNDASASGDTDHDYAGRNKSGVKVYNRSDALLVDKYPEARYYARDFSQAERDRLAKSGEARSDGSYPIETCGDAQNAREAYGRANDSDRSAVASHIRSREKALGGCGREPFKPGDQADVLMGDIDEEFVTSFTNQIGSLRALRGA